MAAADHIGSRARAGQYVGEDGDPDTFRLESYAGRGGEGELWRAVEARPDGRTYHRWALKIMHARDLVHHDDVSPLAELDARYQRYLRSKRETDQLSAAVPGVVGASVVFRGGEPHDAGEQPRGRSLYVLSRWVDGVDLAQWLRRQRPSFDELCDTVEGLAGIVDGMAAHAQNVVHRDISPGNVIVGEDGSIALIDFTYVRPPNTSAGTVAVHNGGYTAPEVYRRTTVGVAADRYSVGAVTYFLLAADEPPTEDVQAGCHIVLLRRGYSAAFADHLVSMLAGDPGQRPDPLLDWARTLRELGGRRPALGGRRVGVNLVVDGSGSAVVLATGDGGLAAARLAPGMPRSLVPDPAAPPLLLSAAAATDGTGGSVVVAVDAAGCLWTRRQRSWAGAGTARPDGGVAVARLPTGGVAGFAVQPEDSRLVAVDLDLGGDVRLTLRPAYASRVLAAANAADGTPVVAALAPGGGLFGIEPGTTSLIADCDVVAADLCLNVWGELLCVYLPAGSGTVEYAEQHSGVWVPSGPLDCAGTALDVACVGTRGGATIAIAGSAGLHLATLDGTEELSPWQQLTDQRCEQVVLDVGAAWRRQLVAVVDHRVVVSAEDFEDRWKQLSPLT